MRSITRLLALAALASLMASQSVADMAEHIKWLTENSTLEYNGEPLPTIERMDYDLMLIEVYGPETVAQAEYHGKEINTVEAFYDHDTDTIVFPVGVDIKEHVLVHELVHYLQDINGTMKECAPANEPQAYRLHAKWQEAHGEEVNQSNIFYGVLLAMACDDRHHYTAEPPSSTQQ